jgi:hypothetical protein
MLKITLVMEISTLEINILILIRKQKISIVIKEVNLKDSKFQTAAE